MRRICLLLLLLDSAGTLAQTAGDSIPANRLEEVEITILRGRDSLMSVAASVGILTPPDLTRQNATDITSALNMVAGVSMQSANFTTARISIRGIGGRTAFGTNKIRAFYGNIPLTSGDSETVIDDLDPESLGGIEILKDGSTAAYGAGLGGAILLHPHERKERGSGLGMSAVAGSDGLFKNRLRYATSDEASALTVQHHHLGSDGWRQNSRLRRDGFGISGNALRKKDRRLDYLAHYTVLKSYLPSSIDRADFEQHPEVAAPTWLAAKGYKSYDTFLGGLAYEMPLAPQLTHQISVSVNYKYNHEARPFDILRQRNLALGARTQFDWKANAGKLPLDVTTGIEVFRDHYSGRTAENRYESNDGNGSLEGLTLTDEGQVRFFYNAYVLAALSVSDRVTINGNLNVNRTRFSLDTRLPDRPKQRYAYDAVWSPGLSVLWRTTSRQTAYLSMNHGFSLPGIAETLQADGTVNTGIRPEKGINLEAGYKSYWMDKKIYTELVTYRMDIRDMLVARRAADDRYIGTNAGKTRHQGIELTIQSVFPGRAVSWSGYIGASYGEFRFQDFRDGESDFSGKRLPNVPSAKASVGIRMETHMGFFFLADARFTDRIALDDANTAYADAWKTIDVKAGYRMARGRFGFTLSAGINNLTGETYAAMVQPNATAFGTALPRFYYPGAPLQGYGMLQANYRL